MKNKFDLALLHDNYDGELSGFFSDLKDKLKDVVKKVKKIGSKLADPLKKVRSKLGRKILGNSNIEKLKKIEDKLEPVKRAAKIAVATFYGGPWLGKIAGGAISAAGATNIGAAVQAYGASLGTGSVVKAVGKEVLKAGVKTVAQTELQKRAAEKAQKETLAIAKSALLKQYNQTVADVKAYFGPQITRAKVTGDSKLVSMLETGLSDALKKVKQGYDAELKDVSAATIQAAMSNVAQYPNSYIQDLAAKVEAHIASKQAENARIAAQIGADKNYQGVIDELLAEGKTIQQAQQEWANSATFKTAASQAAYETIYPALYAQLIAEGLAPESAQYYAHNKATQIAAEETNKVSSGKGAAAVALLALPLIFAAFGG